jgi:hypothetical protein
VEKGQALFFGPGVEACLQEGAEPGAGERALVVAEEPGGVHPGEEGRLAGAGLGQALHPQGGVQGVGAEAQEEREEVFQSFAQSQAVHEEEEHPLSLAEGGFVHLGVDRAG